MKYPKELVEQFGAKAGLLKYVGIELPKIPQATMVVKSPDESIDDFLERARPLSYPRIYRSSAVAELDGYEGDFWSEIVWDFEKERARITNPHYCGPYATKEGYDEHVRKVIEAVENSTVPLRQEGHRDLPKKINVIAAELSPSLVTGTYIKHPNQEGFYLVAASLASSVNGHDPVRSNFTFQDGKAKVLWGYDWLERWDLETPVQKEIEKIIPWHDQMAQLPEMDPTWSYQIEFGLYPSCLYQVRPFKKIEIADFQVERKEGDSLAIVIGTTPPEGLLLRAETKIYGKVCRRTRMNRQKKPAVLVDKLRSAGWAPDYLPNHQANILGNSFGMLAHSDIKAIRQAQVTVLYGIDNSDNYRTGQMLRLFSNGKDFSIEL